MCKQIKRIVFITAAAASLAACSIDQLLDSNDYYSDSGYVRTYHDNSATSGYNRHYNPPPKNSDYYSDKQPKQPQHPPANDEGGYYSDQSSKRHAYRSDMHDTDGAENGGGYTSS